MSDAQDLPARMQERIFDAVLAELAKVGIDEFSIDGVARRAGVDPELLHARWADRRVLLMEAMVVRAGQLSPVPDTGSLKTDLGEVSTSLMKLSDTELGRQWFHRLLPGGRDADLSQVGSDFWAVRMGAVQSIFEHAADRGELRPGVDSRDATRMLAAALYCDVIFNDIPIRPEYAAQVREIFLYGTLAPNIHDESLIEDFENREHIRALLTATIDAMVDPVALVEAVRDDDGRITDFTFQEANPAACVYLQRRYDELIGASMKATLPDIESSGMFARYIDCVQTGEPVIVEDLAYFSQRYQEIRRYDLRGARAGRDWLSMTWRDVTDRSEAIAAIESARNLLRISSDALLDPQLLLEVIQDGPDLPQDLIFKDVNLAFCDYLGKERSEVLGHRFTEIFPGVVDVGVLARYLDSASTGVPVVADDFAYFNEVFGELRYYDIRGRQVQPGLLSLTFRDVTERVEANRRLEEARREQAAADALYRRSMESAAVGMCLASPEGPLFRVNEAMCAFFGHDAETLLTKTWIELTAPEYRDADLANVADMVAGRIESYQMEKQFIHAAGHRVWGHLSVGCLRNPDGSVAMSIGQIVDITAEVANREQLRGALGILTASEERYRLMTQNANDAITHIRDNKFVWVSAAIQNVLGAPPEHWIGRDISEVIPPEDTADYLERLAILEAGGSIHSRFRVRAVDGATHWVETHSSPFFDSQGRRDGFTGTLRVVDDQVDAEAELAEARRRSEAADQLLRRSVDNAAVGMCLTEPEGRFVDVNDALCAFFGYDVTSLKQKTWQDLTAPEYMQADLDSVEAMLAGRLDSYRTLKQFVHADGHRIWGDLSVSCVRDPQGRVEQFIAQIIDVTKAVEINARNVHLNQQISDELRSAARYMASIMPAGLTGPVAVSSRYLPSQHLGGDCFDFRWIDSDHLMVYLLDVSGHGTEAALLAVSVHNQLRSGSLPTEILLQPDRVLTELNARLPMEDNDDHYLTAWYGVYQKSTRTMVYASGGHPPALALSAGQVIPLGTPAPPVGVFSDAAFTTGTYTVPHDSRIVIYSDGAYELPLPGGGYLDWEEFVGIYTELAATPDFSLDGLIATLRSLTATGNFTDDCAVIELHVDGDTGPANFFE